MKSIRHSVVFLVGLMGLVQGFFGGSQLLAKASCTEKQSAGASANGMVVQGLAADSIAPKMQWFADAKLGIFIHWGIYAVEGTSESWSFHSRNTTYPYYMSQLKGFGAEKYDPKAWAALIKESGAQYAVITTQHHDGVALWETKQLTPNTPWSLSSKEPLKVQKPALWNAKLPLSVVAQSPAKRDVIAPFASALREQGLKFGAYYSLLDWSHNDYPGFYNDQGRYKLAEDPIRWQRFLQFMHGQIGELSAQFHPDLFWFDGDWEHSNEEWYAPKIRQDILAANPNAIMNGRLQGYGDYATPEQNMPITKPMLMGSDGKPHNAPWELCLTSNDNWGWRPNDTMMKTSNEVIRIFAECLGMGGNLLLDIGPKADGTITAEQTKLLKDLGRWTSKHAEAIYGSLAGLPAGHFYGPSTISKDSTILYLFVTQVQGMSRDDKYIEEEELEDAINEVLGKSGEDAIEIDGVSGMKCLVMVKGLSNEIESVQVLGTDFVIKPKVVGKISWSSVPGTVFMDVPFDALDEQVTVLKLKLKGPLRLYEGQGGFH
ncbi:MAG: alpha-L-fucosidase [Bacteroidetes bacterium]|nr:alpha-L-fucosidase [Bacteroidota bacterium]